MINPERKPNTFVPGDLVRWWVTKKSRQIVYVYICQDSEDPWTAILLGPEGMTKARYIQLETL